LFKRTAGENFEVEFSIIEFEIDPSLEPISNKKKPEFHILRRITFRLSGLHTGVGIGTPYCIPAFLMKKWFPCSIHRKCH
jgi:hypothetical protein